MLEWKYIKGYRKKYKVYSNGDVKRYKRKTKEWLSSKIGYHKDGYPMVSLYRPIGFTPRHKRCTVHRLVALHFIDNPENKPEVKHKNSIKDDNRVANLEWVTPSENSLHRSKSVGRSSCYSKLDDMQVLTIHTLSNKYSQKALADHYKVKQVTVWSILRGKSWKWMGLT